MTDIDIELDEQYLNDGPVECPGCGEIFPESALMGGGLCADCDYDIECAVAFLSLRYKGEYDD